MSEFLFRSAEAISPGSTAVINRESEVRLGRKKTQQSKHRLIVSNTKFAISIAHEYRGRGVDFDDLVSEAMLGMVKAADKFDPERGTFITIAEYHIRKRIREYLADDGHGISRTLRYMDTVRAVNRTEDVLHSKLERAPTVQEIAKAAEMSPVTVRAAKRYVSVVSSNDLTFDGEEMKDRTPDLNTELPDTIVNRGHVVEAIKNYISSLRPKHRAVVCRRFGIGNRECESLQSIANDFKLTRERIRQIESEAMEKLRTLISHNDPMLDPNYSGAIPEPKTSPHWRNCPKCYRIIVNGDAHTCPPSSKPTICKPTPVPK